MIISPPSINSSFFSYSWSFRSPTSPGEVTPSRRSGCGRRFFNIKCSRCPPSCSCISRVPAYPPNTGPDPRTSWRTCGGRGSWCMCHRFTMCRMWLQGDWWQCLTCSLVPVRRASADSPRWMESTVGDASTWHTQMPILRLPWLRRVQREEARTEESFRTPLTVLRCDGWINHVNSSLDCSLMDGHERKWNGSVGDWWALIFNYRNDSSSSLWIVEDTEWNAASIYI